MTDELKPVRCGCGGEALMSHGMSNGRNDCMIVCTGCGIATRYFDTEAEAIEAWNLAMSGVVVAKNATTERTAKVETVEKPNVFKCAECGQYFHSTAWGSPVAYCPRCGCRLEWG